MTERNPSNRRPGKNQTDLLNRKTLQFMLSPQLRALWTELEEPKRGEAIDMARQSADGEPMRRPRLMRRNRCLRSRLQRRFNCDFRICPFHNARCDQL